MSTIDTSQLEALGQNSKVDPNQFNGPHTNVLERFESPFAQSLHLNAVGSVKIDCPEFTSLCPKTGQPDFARIVIDYVPNKWCVESKSLKLYLMSFRNVGEFHESCVTRIANDLITLLDPETLVVRGEFTPRGGIPFWPEVSYSRPIREFTPTPGHHEPTLKHTRTGHIIPQS